MPITRAIILKSIPYTEKQHILHVFSAEAGFLSCITPSIFLKKKNTPPLQSMQIVEMEYIIPSRGELHPLKQWYPIKNTSQIYFDIYKMNIASLWGNILDIILQNEGKNEELFQYLEHSVEYLNHSQDDTANFNLFFLFRLCLLLGFRIDTTTYKEEYIFDLQDGCFYPTPLPTTPHTGPRTAKVIHTLCTCPLESLKDIHLNQQGRRILLDTLLLFLGEQLNTNLNTKSIQIIKEIFS